MKKTGLLLSLIMVGLLLLFSGCSDDNSNDLTVIVTENSINETEKDIEFTKAQEEMMKCFLYYGIDPDSYENMGLKIFLDTRYIVFLNSSEEYYFYVNLDQNYDIYGSYPLAEEEYWWSNGKPCFDSTHWQLTHGDVYEKTNDQSSFVPISIGVLDKSFEVYLNQTGTKYLSETRQSRCDYFFVNLLDNIQYYYGVDNSIVGIENGNISLFSAIASGGTVRVRDIINSLGFYELFEIQPEFSKIMNSNNIPTEFIYWKVNNGYIGFVINVGSGSIDSCYSYLTRNFIICEDLDFVNIIE